MFGSNDQLATAEIQLALGRQVEFPQELGTDPGARGFQMFDGAQYKEPAELFGGGRRIQIMGMAAQPVEKWCIFEGFVERVMRNWDSNSGDVLSLQLYCNSSIMAADRLPSQYIAGQWRRSWRAHKKLYIDPDMQGVDSNQCVPVTAEPMVFNPGGLFNCDPTPLSFQVGKLVHIPCDVDAKNTPEPWTVARILRYIQWMALQPPMTQPIGNQSAYDRVRFSHPNWSGRQWCAPFRLAHERGEYLSSTELPVTQVGPNLSELVEPYLSRTDTGDPNDPQALAMLRRPADLVISNMSILEAFAVVCDAADIIFSVEHDISTAAQVWTYLRFTVRGDRVAGGPTTPAEHEGAHDDPPSGGSTAPPGGFIPGSENAPGSLRVVNSSSTSRAVKLWGSLGNTLAPETAIAAYRRDSAYSGTLAQSHAEVRQNVVVLGDATQYEVGFKLLPAWSPNAHWDINPADDAAFQNARDYSKTDAFKQAYGPQRVPFATRNVGRYWILNEAGEARPETHKRQHGVWSTNAAWDPFKWRTAGGIFELLDRGDEYWSVRRRRFLPLIAKQDGLFIDPVIQISFDGDGPPDNFVDARHISAAVQLDTERCAVYFTVPDLAAVCHPQTGKTFLDAYLRNTLRVRILANVEGDDALIAWSPAQQGTSPGWVEFINRRGRFPRTLRFQPDNNSPASSTDALITLFGIAGANDNRQAEADRLAKRALDEMAVPRVSGTALIPWLWRNNFGPQVGYRIGDEIIGLDTGDVASTWLFESGRSARERFPRVIGITYRIAEQDLSTTLQIETRISAPDQIEQAADVIDPSYRPINRQAPIASVK